MAVPVPCKHCGYNYMRANEDQFGLCNNCIIAEERRNPKKGEIKMESIDILVKCPKDAYAKLEEHCINDGKDLSTFIIYAALENLEKGSIQHFVSKDTEFSESEEQPKKRLKK